MRISERSMYKSHIINLGVVPYGRGVVFSPTYPVVVQLVEPLPSKQVVAGPSPVYWSNLPAWRNWQRN